MTHFPVTFVRHLSHTFLSPVLQVKYSAAALLDYLRHLASDREATQVFSDIVLQIFRDHQKVDRVTLPMLKMLDQLLANGCFDVFVNDEYVTRHHLPWSYDGFSQALSVMLVISCIQWMLVWFCCLTLSNNIICGGLIRKVTILVGTM